jgi:hypothetical protein
MAAFNPQQYLGQNIGFGSGTLSQLQKQYGLTSQQLQGLRSGVAGQATPTLRLGTSPYSLTMGAGGGSYMIKGPAGTAIPAPAPIAGGAPAPAAPAKPQYAGGSLVPPGLGQTATTPQTPGGPTVQTAFRDQLLKQLAADPNSITLQDPALAAQTRAFSDAQQRAIERAQQEAAEQGFAGGTLGTGAYGQELRGLQQQRGESEAQFGAGLLGEARNQRMQELMNALGLARETIGQGEDIGISLKDLALREAGLKSQEKLGLSDIDLRRMLGQGNLKLGLLQAMMQDRQAANRLGFDIGSFGANLNQNAMLAALGMR